MRAKHRRRANAASALAWFGLATALGGCPGVPDLVFADDADGATSPDGDAGSAETGAPGTCPSAVPSTASVCCGSVACSGNCTTAQCNVCELTCGKGTLCCAKTNNVDCRSLGASCPP